MYWNFTYEYADDGAKFIILSEHDKDTPLWSHFNSLKIARYRCRGKPGMFFKPIFILQYFNILFGLTFHFGTYIPI